MIGVEACGGHQLENGSEKCEKVAPGGFYFRSFGDRYEDLRLR